MCIAGKGPMQIAKLLTDEKVLSATAYYAQLAELPLPPNPYKWNASSIIGILERREYLGCTVNFKTYTKSLKFKKRMETPIEEQRIFENTQEALINFYEKSRYAFTFSREAYEDVTAYLNGGIQVKMGELWGLADGFGKLIIPCSYEYISTFDTANRGCVVALQSDQSVVTLNMKNQIIAKTDINAKQIGNLSQDIAPLQLANEKWIIANSKLVSNNEEYDNISTTYNSAVAVQISGKWGVSTLNGKVVVPYEYDEIIMDELGRCYAQNAVFAKKGGTVYLFIGGKQHSDTYDDARPFTDDGWAAVKKNGKWGFIDASGELKIEYKFENALSFTQNLAAVQTASQIREVVVETAENVIVEPEEPIAQEDITEQDETVEPIEVLEQVEEIKQEKIIEEVENWGYINLKGDVVIEPNFLKAKSFEKGNAPVLTELGWQFISLLEYKKGAGF